MRDYFVVHFCCWFEQYYRNMVPPLPTLPFLTWRILSFSGLHQPAIILADMIGDCSPLQVKWPVHQNFHTLNFLFGTTSISYGRAIYKSAPSARLCLSQQAQSHCGAGFWYCSGLCYWISIVHRRTVGHEAQFLIWWPSPSLILSSNFVRFPFSFCQPVRGFQNSFTFLIYLLSTLVVTSTRCLTS